MIIFGSTSEMAAFKASPECLSSIHNNASIALVKLLVVLKSQNEHHVDVLGFVFNINTFQWTWSWIQSISPDLFL